MAFSYSPALQSDKDIVRFLLQDTVNTTARPAFLDDGEVMWALSTEMNVYMAAAILADTIAARFRGMVRKKVGGLEIQYGVEQWEKVSTRLRQRGASYMTPSAGGITISDRDEIWLDTNLIRPEAYSGLGYDPTNPQPNQLNWRNPEYEP